MYYEEMVINGILCHRGTPDGKWLEFSYEQLLQKYKELQTRNVELSDETAPSIPVPSCDCGGKYVVQRR